MSPAFRSYLELLYAEHQRRMRAYAVASAQEWAPWLPTSMGGYTQVRMLMESLATDPAFAAAGQRGRR